MGVKPEVMKSSEVKYDGKFLTLTYDVATVTKDGVEREAWREVVRHPGATAVVALRDDGKILMERQYRYAVQEALLEVPAGKLDPGESPLACAQRELEEETGFKANSWTFLGTIATSPGFCDEVIHIYLAEGLAEGTVSWDEDEYVELEYFTFDELVAAMAAERIKDGKTLAALMLALPRLRP